ncbi:MAG: DUF371 domain-containing protein [Candidatus Lernaella stagnicola]|nr:DUF371 domain-containing protein [Candidatus Lernaella stagnicola]
MTDEVQKAYGEATIVVMPENPDDLTVRALAVLRAAQMVAAADFERAARLLRHHDIKQIVTRPVLKAVLRRLAAGDNVALLLAGPDDPTGGLVASVDDAGYRVTVLPAVSPLAGMLPAAGYGTSRVNVLGRLPSGAKRRAATLASCAADLRPLAISVAAERIADLVEASRETFGDRLAFFADATGAITRAKLADLPASLPPNLSGEGLLIVAGRDPEDERIDDLTAIGARARELMRDGLTTPEVAKRLVAETCLTRRQAYELARASTTEADFAELSFSFRGHAAIRATHDKTIEFKRENDCGPRETCVVGVSADWDPAALKKARGRVTVEIAVEELSWKTDATINKRFATRDRLVIRKSRHGSDVTLAVAAAAGAAELPRELAARLRDPQCTGVVTIRPAS